MYQKILRSLILCIFILPVIAVQDGHAQQKVVIGLVGDGPTPEFGRLKALFQNEILELTEGEFDVEFNEDHFISGNWSLPEIEKSYRRLLDNPKIDVVLALGFVSSLVVSRAENITKPTFAPLVLDSNLLNLPRDGETSGIRNLNYLTEEVRFMDDVNTFRDIVDFSRLALLVDATIFDSVPELAQSGIDWTRELGVDLTYVVNTSESENLVEKIPPDVEAVIVAALPRLSLEKRQALVNKLNQRKLPSYSLIGTTPVERGMLAATAPDSDWQRLARKNALNIQAVLLGERAGDQPITFRHKRQLTINMETARALDISPRFDILSTATLLNEDVIQSDIEWTLSSVAHEALRSNLSIQSSRMGINASAELIAQARALLKPQFNTSISAVQLDSGSASVRNGIAAERTTSAAIGLSQVIYSESISANVDIQNLNQQGNTESHRAVELDIIQQATVSFLNVLKAQTLVDIRKRTLNLSRTNLDLAQDRVRLGSANASDIYRWQSDVATARQNLLSARAQLQQAMNALNRLLARPLDEKFQTTPASLADKSLLVSQQELIDIIDNQQSFDVMGKLFIEQGLSHSPELKQIDLQIAAAERQLASERRTYWSPDISLSGQITHTLDEHHQLANSAQGELDWQLSLQLTLPLYQGGSRRSRVSQTVYQLHQLKLQRQLTQDIVEQGIRANLHAVQASYPSIELAQTAAEASRKNLELVQDSYAKGAISIIELLDARDAAFNAQQAATDAVYDFLIDLMNLQRSTAEFDFFLDTASRNQATQLIMQAISAQK